MARRLLLVAFIILGLTALASATKIQTSDPGCSGTPESGQSFSFNADANGQGSFTFCNQSSSAWYNLLIAIQTSVPLFDSNNNPNVDCATNGLFANCYLETSDANPGIIYAFFSNPCAGNPRCLPQYPGIPIGGSLIIDLNCNDVNGVPSNVTCSGPAGWDPGAGVNTYTNVPTPQPGGLPNLPGFVPEPTTMSLLAFGLGAVYLKRRRRK